MNTEIICRSCLRSQSDMKSISECDSEFKMRFTHIIKNISNIEIHENDGLPSKICENCISELKQAYRFINQVQTSDITLRKCNFLLQKTEFTCENNETPSNLILYEDPQHSTTENFQINIQSNEQENNSFVEIRSNADHSNRFICELCKKAYYNKTNIEEYSATDNLTELEEENQISQAVIFDSFDKNKDTGNFNAAVENFEKECSKEETVTFELQIEQQNDITENNGVSDDNLNEETSYSAGKQQNDDFQDEISTEDLIKVSDKLDKRKRNNYVCDICEKSFTNKKLLNKHYYMHQERDTPYKCEHCGKDYKKIAHLNVHLRSHIADAEKTFQCTKCDRKFTFEYLLKQHMHKHAETKPFPCPKCDRGCLTEDSLKRHMKTHDKDYKKPKYACTVCQKEFEYPSFLSEHMKNHTGEKSFLCAFCGKMFRHKGAFQYHIRVHDGTRPFQCHVCDKSFTATGILKVHMRCHTNERPYICDICGKAFRQCTDMKSHKRTHTGDKTVECSVCHKKLAQRGQLKIHMRTHTGERPFPCVHCDREFATNTMLIKHTRIHTGERPYVCKICGKAFAQSNTLKTHHKVHTKKKDILV